MNDFKRMNAFKHLLLFNICIVLAGCAASVKLFDVRPPTNVYLDQHFGPPQTLETADEIFAISESMKKYVQLRVKPQPDIKSKTNQMVLDFFDPNQLDIQYKHNANLTASEVFEQNQANCLSLTILSYVLAKHANLNATFMDVTVPENWTYNQGIKMVNGHVNLRVTAELNPTLIVKSEKSYVIDFLPMLRGAKKKSKALGKSDIIALFYNNKGADALVDNNENLAYHYFKQATIIAPQQTEAWGNLASLYSKKGFLKETEAILLFATEAEPNNLNLRESLAYLYNKTNRVDQAKLLKKQILQKRKTNPHYYAMLAKSAFIKGHYTESISHYKHALKLNSQDHQLLFGLAQNYFELGNHLKANYYLEKARKFADDLLDQQKYQSKIYSLQSIAKR